MNATECEESFLWICIQMDSTSDSIHGIEKAGWMQQVNKRRNALPKEEPPC